ncbi:MAG: AbiH family protein [Clostridium sp.]|uniref:AbiH family protein n=1 Tax=Clostridium sp. TaxID=1506 RepID=UPI003F3A654B
MNILVIGNGFDLEHKLPTKYWDFMSFLRVYKTLNMDKERTKRIPNFQKLDSEIQGFLLKDEVFYKNKRNKVLKELDELIEKNIWIKYFEDKIEKSENKGWIDFELEISDVIQALEYLQETNKYVEKNESQDGKKGDFKKDFIIDNFLGKYITIYEENKEKVIGNSFVGDNAKIVIEDLNQMLNGLTRCLEIYIGEVIQKINIKHKNREIEGLEIDGVISFNYSDTYERVYEDKCKKIEYDYIHGKANLQGAMETNSMVLGIDEYLKEDKDEKIDFIKFKKYFQRLYKETSCKYKRWLEIIKENKDGLNEGNQGNIHKLYIFGHSIDVTDKDILRDLILTPNLTTTIFYYDNNVKANYISNLVRIIGQDELRARAWSNNPTIIFKEQKREGTN